MKDANLGSSDVFDSVFFVISELDFTRLERDFFGGAFFIRESNSAAFEHVNNAIGMFVHWTLPPRHYSSFDNAHLPVLQEYFILIGRKFDRILFRSGQCLDAAKDDECD